MALFISGPGQTYSVSVFVDPIINDTSWSRTLVSGMYTAGSLTAAAVMVLVGRMLDRHGARVLMIAVGVLFGFAALWMSQVDSPVELYAGFAAIRTLGQGSLSLIGTTLVALWFVRFRGRAMALSSLGAVASRAAFPPLIHFFISRWQWQGAWVALAVIIWAVTPLALLARRNPEAIGLRPDGARAEPAGTETTPAASDDAGGQLLAGRGRPNAQLLAAALRQLLPFSDQHCSDLPHGVGHHQQRPGRRARGHRAERYGAHVPGGHLRSGVPDGQAAQPVPAWQRRRVS